MSDLLELAARCEAVTGPDRDIDRTLCPIVGIRVVDEGHPLGVCYYDENGHGIPLPLFTRSIDAAMTLVPEGCLFTVRTVWDKMKPAGLGFVSRYEKSEFGGHERLYWMDEHQAVAATPALALCAAAMRARNSLPTAAPAGKTSSSPASLHSLGTGAAEATGGGE